MCLLITFLYKFHHISSLETHQKLGIMSAEFVKSVEGIRKIDLKNQRVYAIYKKIKCLVGFKKKISF